MDEVPLSPLEPRCCGGRLPASVVNKLNKLSARSGLIKMVGEFGLRENLYYGSIFICMTLIVIVCFLVINNGGGAGLISGSGSAAAYDGEQRCELIGDPVHGEVHQTGRYLGDRAIYTCATGWEIVGAEERVCQANGAWTNREPFCKKRGLNFSTYLAIAATNFVGEIARARTHARTQAVAVTGTAVFLKWRRSLQSIAWIPRSCNMPRTMGLRRPPRSLWRRC